jgi:hypothetical protein
MAAPSSLRLRFGPWLGIAAPTLFVATFTVEGLVRPDYHARSMFVSALSLGPRGVVQILNFVQLGAALLLFAAGLRGRFVDGRASKAGPILLAIIGGAIALSGPLVMDPAGTLPRDMTRHGLAHAILGGIVFALMPATLFVFYRRFHVDPAWRALARPTFVAALAVTATILVWRVGPTRPPSPPNELNEWVGAMQRAVLVTFLGWVVALSAMLLRWRGEGIRAPSREGARPR